MATHSKSRAPAFTYGESTHPSQISFAGAKTAFNMVVALRLQKTSPLSLRGGPSNAQPLAPTVMAEQLRDAKSTTLI
jgi:hypothetical protein